MFGKNFVFANKNTSDRNFYFDSSLVVLKNYSSDFSASKNVFHLFTHGRSGELLIDGKWRNSEEIAAWFLTNVDLDKYDYINLYGCEFAKGEKGILAVKNLEKQLHKKISASNNITGAGGDWILEIGSNQNTIAYPSYPYSLQCANYGTAPNQDFDCDGIINSLDIDDDNDGIVDSTESPSCFYLASEWNTGAKPANGVTITSGLTTTTGNFSELTNGVSNTTAVTFTAGQAILNANVYLFTFARAVKLDALYLQFNTVTQFGGTTKIQGSNTNNGSDWVDLSAAIALTAATNVTANGIVSATTSIKYPVTLNKTTAYKYIRITGAAASNIAAQNASEVYFDFNIASYVASYYSKATCVDANIDGDGFAPHMDLDSDGDGCSDAFEAGATTVTTANYVFPYTDSNGDGLVNAVDSDGDGITNYTSTYVAYAKNNLILLCNDSDGDGILDVNDIDDDNDGIPDKDEQALGSCVTTNCDSWVTPPSTGAGTTAPATIIVDGEEVSYTMTTNTSFTQQSGAYTLQCSGANVTNVPYWQRVDANNQTVTFNFSKPVTNFQIVMTAIESAPPGLLESIQVTTNNSTGQQTMCESCNKSGMVTIDSQNITVMGNGTAAEIFNVNGPVFTSVTVKVTSVGGAYLMSYGLCALKTYSESLYTDIDTDSDGIPNRLDLDSDGDNCPDLKEAKVSPATDIITPSALNNVGKSYGIATLSGSQLNPLAADTNNDGLNDSVDTDLNGSPDYSSSYIPSALSKAINLCSDMDGDGIPDLTDIDDDNDGITDAVESPSCFYTTINDLKTTANITSDLSFTSSSQPFPLTIDGNTATWADIDFGIVIDKNLVQLSLPLANPIPLSTVTIQIGINNAFPGSSFQLQGWSGSVWESLSATQAMATSSTTYTFTNTLNTSKAYSKYRIRGLAGYAASGTRLHEVNFTFAQPIVGSLQPRQNCTNDTDGDGIYNHQDLDSDGDGCSDLVESGVSPSTDIFTPSSVNNSNGTSYGITANKLAGSQLNPAAADTNNDGLNDSVDSDLNGITNYASTYIPYAIGSNYAACLDSDGDGILDIDDIDDDNDGILDAVESPSCFYTETEARNLINTTVASDFAWNTSFPLTNAYDGTTTNIAWANTAVTNIAGLGLIDFTVPTQKKTLLSNIQVVVGVTALSSSTSALWRLEGWDGTAWVALSAAQHMNTVSTSYTFSNTLQPAVKYIRYRVAGTTAVAGIPVNGRLVEVYVNYNNYAPSLYPKTNCISDLDGDGIPNHLDLDSDGDGCSDLGESGVNPSTDIFTPSSATNKEGKSYGIISSKLNGSQLNPAAADVNNDGLNDSVDPDLNGIPNYTSTYNPYAIGANIAACLDSDGDGINDVIDIDDDNDGILDAVESPACFYSTAEVTTPTTITSELLPYSTNVAVNTIDNNPATYGAFSPSVNWVGKELYKISLPTAVPITSVQLDLINWALSSTTAMTFKLQGSTNNTTWDDLSAAVASTALSGTFSVNNTLLPNNAYSYYRLLGVAGTSYYGGVTEIRLVSTTYNPSTNPKPTCATDTDGDGILNHLDLDSDGDGCSDAQEGGSTSSLTANYKFTGAVGANGLDNTLETLDNGVVTYTSTYNLYAINSSIKACTDTDGDGIVDVIDIDDDNDGVLDSVECPTLFASMTGNGGFSTAAASITNWYMGLASATLPIAEPFTPTVITITNTGSVYNYGIGGGNQVNSPLTGGLFDMYGGVNTATGVQYILQENDPSRPVVSKLPNVLVAGASYNYSFDLGNRGSGSANKYIVLLYNADTKMPEKIIESGVLNTLPAVSDTPSYKNITGSFIPTSSANYYLLFYPSVSGGANDDFAIDRVAVVGSGVSACDIDNDGIPNYLDLDSDGDGCPDTKEAVLYNHSTEASIVGNVQNGSGGAVTSTVSTPNAMVPGPYGSNGFADALQLASDANAYKYVYTYLFLATLKDISACDNKFLMDIDSDDDGIPDAVESPSCFYTETQAMDITEGVTSDFTWQAANPLSNTYDDNIATTNFGTVTPAISIQNKALITFDLPVIDAALIDNVKLNVGSTAFGTGKWKLQGLDLNTMVWTDLSVSAGQAMSAASTTYTFTNTLMPATRYYSYRIIGIDNINITDTAKLIEFSIQYKNYNPSLHRTKMGCSSDLDGDGVPNYIDRDTDGDGCPDAVEAGISLSLLVPSNFYNIGGEVSGAHVIVGGNYSSNGMSDSVETTPDSGIINYNSTYTLYARNSAFNLCTDTDGDGIPDLIDIDDDNDGIPDAVESPSCFYSYDEISVPSTVTTAVANTGVLSYVNDSNKSTTFAFTNSATKANVTVFEMTPQYPLEATAMEIEMGTGGQTIFSATNASLAIDGWNGTTWVNLLPAFTPPTTGILNFMTFTFTQNQTVKYSKFRLQGLAGTVTNNLVKEIRLIPAITYVASANPKASCSDDYDGDGIPNHHDLDSDNDGCFDKYEAHVTGVTLTGTYSDSLTVPANTTGDVGVNGLSNSVETVNDNAILNYNNTYQYAINAAIKFCTDTDGDGIPDSIDIDDDNDGILDTIEGNSDGEIAIKPTSNAFAFTSCSAPAAVVNNTVTFTTNGGVLSTATAADGFTYGEKGTGVDAGDKYSLTFATPVILSKLMVNSVFAPIGEFTVVYDDNTTATKLPVTIVAGQSPATYGYTNVSSSLSVNIDGTYGPYVANYLWGGSSNGQGGAILSFPTLSETKKIKSITFTIVAIPTGGTATLNGLVAPILRENCNLDTDNDGIPNHLDLDSDGDGCTDAFEAGTYNQSGVTMQAGNIKNGSGGAVTSTVSNPAAVVAGPYGNNGFADSVETAIDSGIYKAAYTYSDATTAAVHNCCPIITNNTISSNQTSCSNSTPAALNGSLPTLTPTGNTVQYQWMSSITSASTGFSNISGAVSQNYTFSAPLSQTTYFKRVAYVTGCSSSDNTSAVVTITVNSDTAGTASSTPTVCINTPITNITHTTSGATGIGTASGLPAGVTAAWATNTITISGIPTASGIFNYSIPLNGGCGGVNATGTITVTALNAAGTASSTPTVCINNAIPNITHTTTGATGIGTASGLPAGVTAGWALNTITISGIPSSSGTFNYTIPLTGGCGSTSAVGTITVTPANTAGSASSSPIVCVDTAISNITHTTTGAIGIGSPIGLPSGVSAAWASNMITISGAPTQSGTFNYSIPLNGGCGAVNAIGTITVTAANTTTAASSNPTVCITSAIPNITHTTTGATGIGAALGLPAGVTAAWASNTITISGTPTESGSFNYSIPLTGGCGSINAVGTITITPANTTTGASSSPTVCINNAITNITHTTTGATGIGSASGLPTGVTASWASNTITISGTPTVSGTFNYSIPLTGSCGSVNAIGTIIVTPANTAGLASSNPTLCINTALVNITHTTTGATGINTASGLPAGVTASWASNTITISGTPTESGTFNYSIPLTGGCANVNATGTITVKAANTTAGASSNPTVCINTALVNITHVTTGATGIGTASGLPAGVTASWASNTITISGTPTSGGTFNYSIPLTGGCSSVNATGSITVTPVNTTTGASSSPTLCINTALINITHTTTGATGIGAASGLPTGVTADWTSNTITISGIPSVSGTFNYNIRLIGGCGTVSAIGTITVKAANTAGSASSTPTVCINNPITNITHTTTGATGIGSASGLPAGVTAVWASNTITISGTPTASGTFNYTIPLTGNCGTVEAAGTITVTPANTAGTASSSPTVCISTAITDITHTTTGATGIGAASGLPSGVTAAWSSNTITISGTPTASGTFDYSIPLTGGCGTVEATGTITVTPANTAGTASSSPIVCISTAIADITHATTGATGIGSASGLPAGVTAAWVSNTITISGTPTESGTFNYSIPLTGGCSNVTATGIITVIPANTAGTASSSPTVCISTAIADITHTTTGATGIGSASGLPAGVAAAWASNTITISGTPTESGIFNYSIPLTGGCSNVNATGTITVTPANTAGIASSSPTVCISTAITAITHTTTGATGIGSASGLPAGVTAAWASNTITISGTPTESGTFNYSIPLTGGCGSVDAIGTITVTPANTAGTASSSPTVCISTAITNITHTTTGATGIGSASGLPAGVTAVWASNTITISGTPSSSGTFNYSIPLTGGCSNVNAVGTITVTPAANAGTLSGASNICVNGTTTFTGNGSSGGSWTSNDGSIATVDAAGIVTGHAVGTVTITYTVSATSPCTAAATATRDVTVASAPNAGTLSGDTEICLGGSTKFIPVGANGTGTWSSTSPGIASIDASTGVVTGESSGIATISYTVTGGAGCSSSTSTVDVTVGVTAGPSAGILTGTQEVCVGESTVFGSSGASAAGAWSTSDPSIASIDGSGAITGLTVGTATITYTVAGGGGCEDAFVSRTITVNPTNTTTAASSNPTVCITSAIPNITHTTTGATGIGAASGLPAGVTAAWVSNTITISGTPTESGSFNYSIPLTGGCGNINAVGTITITPANTTTGASSSPTVCINNAITNITHTTTGATGIGSASGLPAGVTAAWASNTITISGTPTVSGTFNYSIPLTGSCGSVNAIGTINVTPANTAGLASSNPTLCINTALVNITHTTTGATGIDTASGLPAGVTASWASNTITISGTPTESGTFNYSIPLTGGCGSVNATGTITVKAANTTAGASSNPTVCINNAITNITHTTTGATGIGSASGLPAGVTASWASNTITISGTPTSGGTFNYSIPLTGGCSSVNATGSITVTPVNTTTGASSSPTLCINTALINITHTTTGATGIGAASGLPTGVTADWTSNTITISGTPSVSGTFNYNIPLIGGCGTVSAIGTITVKAANTAGSASSTPTVCINNTITNITHTTTGATGIGSASGLPAGVTAVWASNTITISGTPTASGTFNYTIPLTGNCGTVEAAGTITVTPANTAGTASSSPTVCISTAITDITQTTTGATGIGAASGLPAGVTAVWASNTITISGTPTVSGTFDYSIPLTGGCGTVEATGTITVTPANTAGTASSSPIVCINTAIADITHATTGATGIVSASGLPAGVTAAWSSNTITISGTPTESGTFNYSIPLTGGCGTVEATGIITVIPANTAGTASSSPTVCISTAIADIMHTTTGATGIGSASGLPAGVTAAWTSNTITISGTPTESGTFNYSIPLTGGCSNVNATGTITVTPANAAGIASSSPTICISTAITDITHITTGATGIGVASGLPAGVTAAWASNIITISGTPTESGIFNYSIPLTGGCSNVNATGTITVTPANTAGIASSSPTVCINTAITDITHTTTGATGIGSASGLPAGVTAVWASNTITISGTPSSSGTFNYSIPLTGGCSIVNAVGTITVTPANTAGTASSSPSVCINTVLTNITHTTTGATGIGTASGLPVGVTASWGSDMITISGTPTVIGTFNYSIPLLGGCSNVNAAGIITVVSENTAAAASSSPVVCMNTAIADVTHVTAGATGIGTASGLPAGVTAVWASNTITISGTPAEDGTFNYSIPLTGGCGSINATGTITVTAAPNAGVISGNLSLCGSLTTVYSSSQSGGTWSSSDLTIASIDTNTGVLTGISEGKAMIKYTVNGTGGCTDAIAEQEITILSMSVCASLELNKTAVFNDTNNNGIAEAGETITYSFTVKNTGSVNITDITISDPLVTVTGGPISLAPNASDSTTFTAVYTIKQSDVDAGKITNSATATGTNPSGTPVTATSDDPLTPAPGDSTVIDLPQSGKLDLKKTAVFNDTNNNGIAEAGETITYSFTVKNTGNVTITGITINDPLVTVTGGPISLAPNASDSTTFTAVYTIKQSDVDAGKITNSATTTGKDPNNTTVTVTSDDPLTPAPGDSTIIDLPQSGKLDLKKTAVFNDTNNNGIAEAGETITYTFTVKNTGNVTITGITINDPLVAVTGGPISLAPNVSDSTTFTAVYTIKQSDVDAGKITNSATATGTNPSGTPVTATSDDPLTPAPGDSTVIDLPQSGKLDLKKTAVFNDTNNNGIAEVGETITYTFTVKNTGNVTITGITINDPLVAVTGGPISLAPNVSDSTTFTAVYTIKQSDVDAGKITNSATATGKDPNNTTVTVTSDDPLTPAPGDSTVIDLPQSGKLDLKKTAVFNDTNNNGIAEAGETITYSFTVKNTGSVTITGITISDPLVAVTGGPISLAPNVSDSTTFTAVYTIKQSDVDAGKITNSATATGKNPSGTPVTATSDDPLTPAPGDSTVIDLPQSGKLDLKKTAVFNDSNNNGIAEAGETITYSFTVKNTGNVTITGITINDPLVAVTGGPISLAPNASDSTTFTAVYTIKQSDVDAGKITNSATATGTNPSGTPVTATSDDPLTPAPGDSTVIDLPQSGKLDLKKTAVFNDTNNNGIAEAGETITYSFTIKNTGNVTITGITINDPLVTVTGGPISLAPNASDSTTFTAVYTIKQSDVDAGKITNSATAAGKDPNNTTVTATSDDPLTPALGDSTVIDLPQSGKLDLKKTAVFNDTNNNGIAEAGETITYSFTVKNTGNVTITGITINDPLVAVTGGPISLAPNASDSTTFTAVYTIKQSDVDAGKITNSATATGTNPSGTPVTVTSDDPLTPAPGDSTIIDLPQSGNLELMKMAVFNDLNGDGIPEAGETITYTFTVKNIGSVTISNITINDPMVTVTGGPISLAPDAKDNTTFRAVYTVLQSDIDAGQVSNLAIVSGKTPDGTLVTAASDDPMTATPRDRTITPLPQSGKLDFKKTAVFNDENGNKTAEAGETITYSFIVKNTGSVTIKGITINDPLVAVTGGPIDLAPNASDSTTFKAVYKLTQDDVNAEGVTNQALVIGTEAGGIPIAAVSDDPSTPAPEDSTVTLLQPHGAISLKKKGEFNDINGNGSAEAGETITYSFEISNTGAVDLLNVALDDQLEGIVITGKTIPVLAVGATDSTTFKGTYTLTQADINRKQVDNQAVVSANTVKGQKVLAKSDDPLTAAVEDATVIHLKACELIVYDIVSPDGDGKNEELVIEGLDCYTSNKVEIYNRWGIKVFEMENYGTNGNAFNGYSDGRATYKRGQKLPTGTYYYILLVIDSNNTIHEKTGPIYVITD
ncbi:hypothetical protein B0A81_10155 [Flavobacterium plurextorum]|uniref:BIG2 domain-containing protein n=1 Tax=Flavobacterium plurextorum TaxID=1114867 RepID=A0ABX4CVJ8_9FLAO|nr:hypothetical protein B0A81_10155 [Flavobacterium plurextorum]